MSAAIAKKVRDAALLYSAAFAQGVESFKKNAKDLTYQEKALTIPVPGTEEAVFAFLAEMPLFQKVKGERTTKRLKTGAYSVKVDDYNFRYSITKNDVKFDRFQILAPHMESAGLASHRFYEDNVTATQVAGTSLVCFDGQPYYDVDHPEGLDGSGSVFSNLHTSMAFTADNIATRMAYGAQIKDANGKRFGVRYNICEFGPDHIVDARKIFEMDIVAAGALTSTSNAGVTNFMKFLSLTPVLNNDLPPGAWYLHDTRFMKPFIIAEETPPTGLQMRIDPTDQSVWDNDEFLFGADATAGFGVGLPQLSVKCVE